ncbi:hypothetical protein [Paludibacterium yongneupense]|uniref:hypothetical protein n=1 Tax=Paludibacterium yongneupense TaxID=400061 RepID=UPI00048EACD1|nr:hypothetical protein [Paludibacterium yongneupense]
MTTNPIAVPPDISFRELADGLIRHRMLLLGCALAGAVLAAGLAWHTPPLFRASTPLFTPTRMWPRWLAPTITPRIMDLAGSDTLYDSLAHSPELASLFPTPDIATRRQWLRQKLVTGVDSDRELQFTATDTRPDVAVRLSFAMATAMRQRLLLAHLTEHSAKKDSLSVQLAALKPLLLKAGQNVQRSLAPGKPALTPTELALLRDMAGLQVGQLPNPGDPALLRTVPDFPSSARPADVSNLIGRYQYYQALSKALQEQIAKEDSLARNEVTVGPVPLPSPPVSPKTTVLLATGTSCGLLIGLALIALRRR